MKVIVNKNEYPVVILEESNVKSKHTDSDIKQFRIEFTIYDSKDKEALSDILSEKQITIINGEANIYLIQNSSYSNQSNEKGQKYKLEIQEIENLSLEVLNIDGIEFKPYFYKEEILHDRLYVISKIKTDKKGFDFLNEKKFSKELSTIIRAGISDKPIQAKIHSEQEWSEANGEYKLFIVFSQIGKKEKDSPLINELAHVRNHSIVNRALAKVILDKLVQKSILSKSESDAILEESITHIQKELTLYYKVPDIG